MRYSKIITIGLSIVFRFSLPLLGQQPDQKTLLWKLEGPNINSSYIFGTIHLLPQDQFEIENKVSDAFKESQQIVLEVDMDAPDLQLKIAQHMPMKDGQTLEQLMTPEDYLKLDSVLTNLVGAGVQVFNTWKPMGLAGILVTQFIEGSPASFEATFLKMAQEQEKEILGLEAPEEQLSYFDSIPYSSQVEDIVEILDEPERSAAFFAEMVDMYRQEDLNGLYAFITEYMDSETEVEYILNRRNANWISRIEELAAAQSTFFGVGAGHLAGDQGVLNLLEAQGYTLTPVY